MRKLTTSVSNGKSDVLLLTGIPNLQYFFNYGGQSFERLACGLISCETGNSALVIPKLDESKAESSPADSVHPWTDSEGYEDALTAAFKEIGATNAKNIGCEEWLAFWQMEAVRRVSRVSKFESITPQISNLRVCKDEEEIKSILDAGDILAEGYRAVAEGLLRVGMSERQGSFEIRKILSDAGALSVDFCAVQSGRNSAIPHLETTSKKIENGDAVLIDISMKNEDGYFADFTRTFVAGEPSDELMRIHGVVEKAQKAGIKAAEVSGATPDSVDTATRNVVSEAGMSEFFFHRTGHGIGLEVHELPWIVKGNRSRLKKGMTFTVEPGIYLEGKFGVRIEDNLILGSGKPIDIPHLSRDLLEI